MTNFNFQFYKIEYLIGGGEDGSADVRWQRRHPVVQLLVVGDVEATLETLRDVIEVEVVQLGVKFLTLSLVKLFPECELRLKRKKI